MAVGGVSKTQLKIGENMNSLFFTKLRSKTDEDQESKVLYALQHTIRNRAAQTLLSWCFLNKYISPRAVMTLVTFFRTVTMATLMYFRLHIIQMDKQI